MLRSSHHRGPWRPDPSIWLWQDSEWFPYLQSSLFAPEAPPSPKSYRTGTHLLLFPLSKRVILQTNTGDQEKQDLSSIQEGRNTLPTKLEISLAMSFHKAQSFLPVCRQKQRSSCLLLLNVIFLHRGGTKPAGCSLRPACYQGPASPPVASSALTKGWSPWGGWRQHGQLWEEAWWAETSGLISGWKGEIVLSLFSWVFSFPSLLFLSLWFHPSNFLHLLACLSFYIKHFYSFSFLKRNKLKRKPKDVFSTSVKNAVYSEKLKPVSESRWCFTREYFCNCPSQNIRWNQYVLTSWREKSPQYASVSRTTWFRGCNPYC